MGFLGWMTFRDRTIGWCRPVASMASVIVFPTPPVPPGTATTTMLENFDSGREYQLELAIEKIVSWKGELVERKGVMEIFILRRKIKKYENREYSSNQNPGGFMRLQMSLEHYAI